MVIHFAAQGLTCLGGFNKKTLNVVSYDALYLSSLYSKNMSHVHLNVFR